MCVCVCVFVCVCVYADSQKVNTQRHFLLCNRVAVIVLCNRVAVLLPFLSFSVSLPFPPSRSFSLSPFLSLSLSVSLSLNSLSLSLETPFQKTFLERQGQDSFAKEPGCHRALFPKQTCHYLELTHHYHPN